MADKLFKTHPRNFGKDSRRCRITNSCRGVIQKYGLNMSRKCFRERAELIGFVKYN